MSTPITALVVMLVALSSMAAARAHGENAHERAPGSTASPVDGAATVPWSGTAVPELKLELAAQGEHYDLQLHARNFAFASDPAGSAPAVVGDGHAHLYVDGEKHARLFGLLYRLPALAPGVHELMVEFVDHQHAAYVVDGRPLQARLIVLVSTRASRGSTAYRDFAVALTAGTVATDTLRVKQYEIVRLAVSADENAKLHVHAYDIEFEVTPTTPVTVQFQVDIAGRFPVARHVTGAGHGHGHRALFYLEVHPD